jgi:hypothetical protein
LRARCRRYAAIAGQGGIAKLVILPHEGHGYQARESILHCLAEQHDWLMRWVVDKETKPDRPGDNEDSKDRIKTLPAKAVLWLAVSALAVSVVIAVAARKHRS